MITTQFIGRLGNSMFQVAAAIGYARKYGYQWGVPNEQKESTILTHFPNLQRCEHRYRRYNEHQPGHGHDWFNYHEVPDHGPDTLLFGFWQSWKYFEHCKEEVKQVFKLEHVPGYEDYVSIHVRRGDYVVHSGSFPPITKEYVMDAIRKLWENNKPQKFIVFSDDIDWCKKEFNGDNWISESDINSPLQVRYELSFEYSEGRNELQDLSLMASCGHHIIANSSFSWWGAYLGHNPNKIVISPSCVNPNWFGPTAGVKHDVVDLLPPEWVQIKFR